MGVITKLFVLLFALGLLNTLKAQNEVEKPKFRILAPQFVCPKDEESLIAKPDETVIMIQTAADSNLKPEFRVRWTPLEAPSQRFTLLVWRAVRALETMLNTPQPVANLYVIENDQLLKGINYEITVTGTSNGVKSDSKKFHIDNSQGNKKLENIDGQTDNNMFSINLLGSEVAFVDIDYVIEAQVTTCYPTEDYHFVWSVLSLDLAHQVDVSQTPGSRLTVPANSMRPGLVYDAGCQVIRTSNKDVITQTSLQYQVLRRGVEVHMSADDLVLSTNTSLIVEAGIASHDFNVDDVKFEWSCNFNNKPCAFFVSENVNEIILESGLPEVGQYELNVKVSIKDEFGNSTMTITAIEHHLPVLQLAANPRILNEGGMISLTANATNITPSCSFTWYFDDKALSANSREDACIEGKCQHGTPITETLTIYSLEENFLNELADFSNETEWRQITAEMAAKAGRARFVAECGCSLAMGCENKGLVYADVYYTLNESPRAGSVWISPSTGVALESIHRISTIAVSDPDTPLKYMFYCSLGDDRSLLLAFYYEHLYVETFLPYVEGGTDVWVEVCDVRGACSPGAPSRVHLAAGQGRTAAALTDTARAHLRRCELIMLQRVAIATIVTYTNIKSEEVLSEFSSRLKEMLSSEEAAACKLNNYHQYEQFVQALAEIGFDTS